jgi:dTDP-glucose 4,6-dehydratase
MSLNKNLLITGACGFIGHHLVEYLLEKTQHNITIIDKLSYASFGLKRLQQIGALNNDRVKIHIYDLCSEFEIGFIEQLYDIDIIIHLAAETHVDNSIANPKHCILNNIESTINMLELAKQLNIEKFIYFSTDEVYGPALDDAIFSEDSRHNPTNPYSASKSASEMICKSYANTFEIPLIICNVMNVFGERQHNEKFIPICIKNILNEKEITIHSYPIQKNQKAKSGSRFYIYAKNVASAINFVMCNGEIGETYNIPGQDEVDNDIVCDKIAEILQKTPKKKYVDKDSKRPGNDLRYALHGTKLVDMGWKPEGNFNDHLERIVKWTSNNPLWM